MPIQQSFGRSLERNCTVRLFWPAIVVLLQVLALPQLVYGQQVEAERYLLDNVRVIVGDGSILESGALMIEGGRITAVGLRSEIESGLGVEVIDLSGKTIMPALIDSHAHLGYEGHTSWGAENYSRENLIDHLQRYAYYGFSAVFSAGSDPDALAYQVQQAQLAGEFPSARFLFAAGMAPPGQGPNDQFLTHAVALEQPVSYTHLTLPTICSV